MIDSKITGNKGEDIACDFLKKNGYKILERNINLSNKELDIVASVKGMIVFVEVKTHNVFAPGRAEDAMTSRKLHHLKKAISMYVNNKKIDPNNIRLDLICVNIDSVNKNTNISHYIDIF